MSRDNNGSFESNEPSVGVGSVALEGDVDGELSPRMAALGQQVSGLVHELNNPLSYLGFNAESLSSLLPEYLGALKRCAVEITEAFGESRAKVLLGDAYEMLDDQSLREIEQTCQDIRGGVRELAELVENAGIYASLTEMGPAPEPLGRVMAATLAVAHNSLKYSAKLICDYPGDLPVEVDGSAAAHSIMQALLAMKDLIPKGDPFSHELTISAKGSAVDATVEITLRCADTKGGHYNLNATHSGFDAARKIASMAKGSLSLSSLADGAARVVVQLPAVHFREVPKKEKEKSSNVETKGSPKRGRILVVDDDRTLRAAVVRGLSFQHEVIDTGSGASAIEILDGDADFDAILTDLAMPEGDGAQLYEDVSKRWPQLAPKMLFMCGGATTGRLKAFAKEMDQVMVAKPFEMDDLVARVSDIVDSSDLGRSARG